MTCPVVLPHMTPCHMQQSWPLHEPSRFAGSSIIPDLKDSSAALSDAKQLRLLYFAGLAMKVADVVVAVAAATSKKQSAACIAWCEVEGCTAIPAIVLVIRSRLRPFCKAVHILVILV